MFYAYAMQASFFGRSDLERWRRQLAPLMGAVTLLPPRSPIGQLVKSMISGRTRDAVSQATYDRLVATFGSPRRVAAAEPDTVLAVIADVTFAEEKAKHLVEALRRIGAELPGFALEFLADWPLADALAWLERLPGVGRKVAASTLNASTLGRPVFIVDSHVLRVLQRLCFVAANATLKLASETVTAAMPHWSGTDFLHFHVTAKLLGQHICRYERPDCARCPLAGECPSRLTR